MYDYEKEYLNYLIENKKYINTDVLDNFFLNIINFYELTKKVNIDYILSYEQFKKIKKMENILNGKNI